MRDPRHTRQRAAIAACFKAAGTFLTIAQAHQEAQRRDESIGLSTVYRTVHLLLEEGALDSAHDATGTAVYRHCERPDPHRHLICRGCGTVVEIDPPNLESALWSAHTAGYGEVSAQVEVTGLCRACARARTEMTGDAVRRPRPSC